MTDIVVHPATGEVLEQLDTQPAETLAEALDATHARQDELKAWETAIAAELRRRLKLRQARVAVFGEWEVESSVKRESSWDAETLEDALERYELSDAVRALDGPIVTREPVVSRSRAKALLRRLTGDAYNAVEAACTWHEKPGPLTVTRSVDLLDAAVTSPEGERAPSIDPLPSPAGPAPPSPDLDSERLFA